VAYVLHRLLSRSVSICTELVSANDPKRTLEPDGHALPPAINLLLKSPQNGQSLWLKAGMNGG
jgi:hypothetical protein